MLTRAVFIACLAICSKIYGQDGPIKIHLQNGIVVATNYARLQNASGFNGAHVRINDAKGEKISIKEVLYIHGYDQQRQYRYFKPIKFQAGAVWGERTYKS